MISDLGSSPPLKRQNTSGRYLRQKQSWILSSIYEDFDGLEPDFGPFDHQTIVFHPYLREVAL